MTVKTVFEKKYIYCLFFTIFILLSRMFSGVHAQMLYFCTGIDVVLLHWYSLPTLYTQVHWCIVSMFCIWWNCVVCIGAGNIECIRDLVKILYLNGQQAIPHADTRDWTLDATEGSQCPANWPDLIAYCLFRSRQNTSVLKYLCC